ncbi:MAG: NifB/NifX family molybdenum-iron cluster-binding protein [Candidatus Kryptonium sp.]|nr:NifB/NifX family molybdenum-iron cluster-binding protein [Candidatus Kryptonium sp.]MCX7762965.1 NifB/NifX family molybdenum-iron cluster-binding protein [Candidatus Kryptonium sp.]MDW8108566.1 NifB/NifX family molybdenum-iron cluster-binding protein [Candidatus Kryptonium sp.]
MKIAIPTDDGEHISDAFGHAHYFLITDETEKEIELRHNPKAHEGHHHRHSHNTKEKQARINAISESLKDVEVIITSHIGKPMMEKMLADGKVIYISPKGLKISQVLNLYLNGSLKRISTLT